jgi:hypothetical protein
MTKDLPTGLSMPLTRKHLDTFNKNIPRINKDKLSLFGFLDVTLKVKETRIISPLVIKYDGKLMDVYGEARITLFSKELNFILNNGGEIIKIHQGYIYERSKFLSNFAEDLYNLRKQSKDLTLTCLSNHINVIIWMMIPIWTNLTN